MLLLPLNAIVVKSCRIPPGSVHLIQAKKLCLPHVVLQFSCRLLWHLARPRHRSTRHCFRPWCPNRKSEGPDHAAFEKASKNGTFRKPRSRTTIESSAVGNRNQINHHEIEDLG